MYKRYKQDWIKHIDFFIIDEIALQIAFIIASYVRHGYAPYESERYLNLAMWLALVDIVVLILFSSMHNVMKRGFIDEIGECIRHASLVFGISAVYLFVTKLSDNFSRTVILLGYILFVIITYALRLLWKVVLRNFFYVGSKKRVMVVVLHSTNAKKTIDRLINSNVGRFFIAGVVLDKKTELKDILGVPIIATMDDVTDYIATRSFRTEQGRPE